ncbi:MAG: helicase-related protein, partial [Lachnospiraceae bacterium]
LMLSSVQYLVIDEADLMLDMGFLEEVEQIIQALPQNRTIMLLSATLREDTQMLISRYMQAPVSVMLESDTQTLDTTLQIAYWIEKEDKYAGLLQILEQENPQDCMIFCATREMVNVLCQKMKRDHIRCGMIHGELEQRDRLDTIAAFRAGRFHYLIATDVAARGIDFDHITHVINYDFPTGKETYVHRIGRTGRNGKTGIAISFVAQSERHMLETVESYIGTSIQVVTLNTVTQHMEEHAVQAKAFWNRQRERIITKETKGAILNRDIMRLSIGGGRKSKMRTVDIVGAICGIEGIEAADIGIIDIRDSLTYVEILHGKGKIALTALQDKTIKGKVRKVRETGGKRR